MPLQASSNWWSLWKEAHGMRHNSILVFCLIAATLLTACTFGTGPTSQSTSEPPGLGAPPPTSVDTSAGNAAASATSQAVTIPFAALDEQKPIYEPLIAKFEQENPNIRVQF